MRVSTTPLAFDDRGTGEPALLCLPGWCENRSAFSRLVELESANRRALSIDWRGHGESGPVDRDFTSEDLVADVIGFLDERGVGEIVPVTISHAGWIAVTLRRRLGQRVSRAVFLDWIMTAPPATFLATLNGLRDPERWRKTRASLFSSWMGRGSFPEVMHHIADEMGAYGQEMWARSAREIGLAYGQWGSPQNALASIHPSLPVLHLYSQPKDEAYLWAQQAFAEAHPWFRVHRLHGQTHFPSLEIPEETVEAIEGFIREPFPPDPAG
jgi:pimeloyl-ACP methyl ester carboxylesterase